MNRFSTLTVPPSPPVDESGLVPVDGSRAMTGTLDAPAIAGTSTPSTIPLSPSWLLLLEEASGNRIDEIASDAFTPTNAPGRAAGYVPGKFALDLERDSAQYLVRTTTASKYRPGNDAWTLAARIKPESIPGNMAIYEAYKDGTDRAVILTLLSTGILRLSVRNNDNSAFVSVDTVTPISAGAWAIVACGHDPDTDVIWIRVDEQAVVEAAFDPLGGRTGIDFAKVGENAVGGDRFDGLIDTIGGWPRRWTDDEFDQYQVATELYAAASAYLDLETRVRLPEDAPVQARELGFESGRVAYNDGVNGKRNLAHTVDLDALLPIDGSRAMTGQLQCISGTASPAAPGCAIGGPTTGWLSELGANKVVRLLVDSTELFNAWKGNYAEFLLPLRTPQGLQLAGTTSRITGAGVEVVLYGNNVLMAYFDGRLMSASGLGLRLNSSAFDLDTIIFSDAGEAVRLDASANSGVGELQLRCPTLYPVDVVPDAEHEQGYDRTTHRRTIHDGSTLQSLAYLSDVGGYDVIVIEQQMAAGSQGGDFTAGDWRTRPLNTEVVDSGGHASVATNQITLAAGTYLCFARGSCIGVANHQMRLRNVTDGANLLLGDTLYNSNGVSMNVPGHVSGRFTIADAKILELQHRCAVTKATDGFGNPVNWGNNEVYAQVFLLREQG